MDGIAIASAAYVKGQRRFWIEGMQKAGEPQRQLSSQEGCLEVMTGAVLPHEWTAWFRWKRFLFRKDMPPY